ncbi:MAG: EAL domain-containing protein [Gammaproteobacteria bacterium]|nr:EAL domain-containing protein [Gammaproteobacteria bacterium]
MKRLLLQFPLRVAIPLLLLLLALVWSAYALYHDTRLEDLRIEAASRDELTQEMSSLQRVIEYLLLKGDVEGVQLAIVPLGSHPNLQYALLADDNDIIRFATRRAWIGRPVREVSPATHSDSMTRARTMLAGEVTVAQDRRSVLGYYPVVLGAKSGELRPTRTGILFILYDLEGPKQAGRRVVQRHVLQSAALMAGLSALLWLLSHFVVTRRVARIVSTAERLAAGDRAAQTGLHGRDELGRIGQAFDQMARKIEADNGRLIESKLRLEHQALHDALTNLPNRALLEDRLQQAVLTCARDNKPLALLVMDLDRFKEVNDSLGHHSGDQLLQQVALRLQNTLRKSDTVARLGGDEFAVLLPGADAERAIQAARVLITTLEAAFHLEGQMLDVRASIGIALFPAHGTDEATLLRRADVAMYAAKRAHSGYALYDSGQDQDSLLRLTLTSALTHAIEQQELVLHYQPKVAFSSGRVVSAEALVRWQRPGQGLLPPDEFIPLAERTGLIRPLTQFVLHETVRQCAAWRRAGIDLTLAVNLSARNLHEAQLAEQMVAYLEEWDVPPACLELEITESAIMTDPMRALAVLTRLDAMGVRLAIDDFGTGYSSLAYLKKLPVDTLKIDKSFVMGMAQDGNDAVIVRSTIDLAHNLGLRVVAEGVENQQTWDMLDELGCDIAQGYFLTRPLASADFMTWLGQAPLTSLRAMHSARRASSE